MPAAEPVLICALSGRALAEAARAAGFAPIVLDAFADLDTRAAATSWRRIPVDRRWRLRARPLLAAAWALAPPPIPLVWGSGFERSPALLAALQAGREPWGNDAATVRAIKDPLGFAATVRRLGLAHPETRTTAPRRALGWLCKRAGGAGGGHVRPAGRRARGLGGYWQRAVPGSPIATLVCANRRDARVLAFGRQLTVPARGRRFRFGGTLTPADLSPRAQADLAQAARLLAAHYRLAGLLSVDALVTEDTVTVLEVNPRPGGSLDAYRAALDLDLFAAHVAAGRDGALPPAAGSPRHAGTLVVFSDRAVEVPTELAWPAWVSDRPPAGTRILAGGPICTVRAQGSTATEVLDLVATRSRRVAAALALRTDGRRRAGGCALSAGAVAV